MAKTKNNEKEYIVDDKDKKILNALLKDSRMSSRKIAKKTGVSVVTVLQRMKKLKNSGILKGYTAILDYERMGLDMIAMINVRVQKGKLFQVEQKIAIHPNVEAVYDITGDFDAAIIVRFRNRRGLDSFVKKIQTYEFVERTNTKLVLNEIEKRGIII